MKPLIMLHAVTRRERHAATGVVFELINQSGGWVDDVHLFSNKMTNIRLFLPEMRFAPLLAALEENQIQVGEPKESLSADSDEERMATLQLTFLHDEPDLAREVPPIPG